MQKKTKNRKKILLFVLSFALLFSFLLPIFPQMTFAENSVYSNVLDDLQKDESFNVDNYPFIEDNYSLQVIQIAESKDNELFVYVYQPSGNKKDLTATEIRISTGINENGKWVDYKLKKLNSNDVFFKYKVENFNIKNDVLRYYDIPCIFRKFDIDIDKNIEGDNNIDYVGFNVSKLWTATTINSEVTYTCMKAETILITDKYLGSYRYSNGFSWFADSCDSHYVAFSTDRPMERLLEADVSYIEVPIAKYWKLISNEWGYVTNDYYNVPVSKSVKLRDTEEATNTPYWLGGKSYSWKRIEKVSDFLNDKDVNLSEETKTQLKDKEWVLRFAETIFDTKGDYYYENWVTEVSILRLKFETNEDVFNLGVVDNKQSGDNIPDKNNGLPDWLNWLIRILLSFLALILIIVLFPVLVPLFPIILNCLVWFLKGLAKVCWYVLKGFWWVITAPLSIFSD